MTRQAGFNHSEEVKARIGQGVSHARHASSHQTQEYYRSKIKTGRIISVLCQIAEGTIEGKPNQVAAATILLRKVLPDLQSVDVKAEGHVTLRTIITGVVRAEDLASSPSLPKVIDHLPSDCDPSASSSASPASPTEQQTVRADLIEKEGEGGGE